MVNPDEVILDLKKYFKKLYNLIDNEANFTLLTVKIVDKKKIDDILCCIEVSWPKEYKLYLEKFGIMKLKSNKYYLQLSEAIKNKFWFSTDVYSVQYDSALRLIRAILDVIDSDIRFVYSDQSGLD